MIIIICLLLKRRCLWSLQHAVNIARDGDVIAVGRRLSRPIAASNSCVWQSVADHIVEPVRLHDGFAGSIVRWCSILLHEDRGTGNFVWLRWLRATAMKTRGIFVMKMGIYKHGRSQYREHTNGRLRRPPPSSTIQGFT